MGRRELILGTAGHIDHGKTALVRALTGIDTDRLRQERERGISIDLGFAHLDLGDRRVGIVDVPGHERFIRNMLAGACGVDLALLVVAADDSVMPQTREHLAILKLLEVERGVVALTKTDLAEPSWVDLVEQEVRDLVAGTFLEAAPIVRTSAVTGAGLDDLRRVLSEACVAAGDEGEPESGRPFRLAVDRAFVLPGLGTVVTGTVSAGRVRVGDELDRLPGGGTVRVRGLQSHGVDVEAAGRGRRAALDITGAHHTEIARGHVLASPGYLTPSSLLTVHLRLLEDSPRPLKHRGRVRLHLGTQEVMAGVSLLDRNALTPGESCPAQLACAEPAVAVGGQPFVIRAESPLLTLGGGAVLQPVARRIRRRDGVAIRRLGDLESADERTRVAAVLFFAGARQLSALDLGRDAAVPPDRVATLLAHLDGEGVTLRLDGGARLHRDVFGGLTTAIAGVLRRFHDASPLETAMPLAALARRLESVDRAILLGVVRRLLAESTLAGDERAVALPDFEPVLTRAQRRLRGAVVDAFRSAGLTPPSLPEVSRTLGVDESALRPIVELCVDEGLLARLGDGIFLHRDGEARARRRLEERLRDGAGLTVSEIKDVLGISRKYAVPLCEHLDRIGFTRRIDDRRVRADPA